MRFLVSSSTRPPCLPRRTDPLIRDGKKVHRGIRMSPVHHQGSDTTPHPGYRTAADRIPNAPNARQPCVPSSWRITQPPGETCPSAHHTPPFLRPHARRHRTQPAPPSTKSPPVQPVQAAGPPTAGPPRGSPAREGPCGPGRTTHTMMIHPNRRPSRSIASIPPSSRAGPWRWLTAWRAARAELTCPRAGGERAGGPFINSLHATVRYVRGVARLIMPLHRRPHHRSRSWVQYAAIVVCRC